MNQNDFIEMKQEIGPNVALEFAKSHGVPFAQIQLWNTQDEAMRNCKIPQSSVYSLQRRAN